MSKWVSQTNKSLKATNLEPCSLGQRFRCHRNSPGNIRLHHTCYPDTLKDTGTCIWNLKKKNKFNAKTQILSIYKFVNRLTFVMIVCALTYFVFSTALICNNLELSFFHLLFLKVLCKIYASYHLLKTLFNLISLRYNPDIFCFEAVQRCSRKLRRIRPIFCVLHLYCNFDRGWL